MKRNLIPEGEHLLTLVSVDQKDFPSFNDPSIMEPNWVWQFKSHITDKETGEKHELRQYTKPYYGNPKAGLTILLDQMFPVMSDEEKGNIDTDEHLGKTYRANILHQKTGKTGTDGKPETKAKLAVIAPYVKKAKEADSPPLAAFFAAAPAPVTAANADGEEPNEDDIDPFEGE